MRGFCTMDVMAAVRVADNIGVDNVIKKTVEEYSGNSPKRLGIEIVWNIMLSTAKNPEAEMSIYEFLSGPLEKKVDEVKLMPLPKLADAILECADPQEWLNFFEVVQKFREGLKK